PDEATSAEPVAADGNTERETSASEFQFGAAHVAAGEESPYLERPPNGYLADVVILEWLDYLVDAYDARNAVRAINYYERIGWIGEPMRDHCVEVLLGITDAEYLYRDEFGTTDITMQDHRKSLGYVEELAGGQLDRTFVERLDTLGTNGV
ncbi:MAG: FlaD/FlaE family flagellar protein, partial [Halanaeroarchaeum sp.]